MKIAIIGASGKSGRLLAREAAARGHEVTAIVRDKNRAADLTAKVIEKDILALAYDDLKDYDVVIDAFGVWDPKELSKHHTTLMHLADLLSGKHNRLLVVGGAGSLYVDPEHTLRHVDSPTFIEAHKPVANAMMKAFLALSARTDVEWTYLSPPAKFDPEGKRTGAYIVGGDELPLNSKGQSYISYADYAIAMIDEAEKGLHPQARFTVAGE